MFQGDTLEDPRVVCIEDSASSRRLVEMVLASHRSATVHSAALGADGLELVREHLPDLVVLNLNLPDMHGFHVLFDLKWDERTKDVPVIVTSANASQDEIELMFSAGAWACLSKPFDLQELLRTMDAAIWFGWLSVAA